MDVQSKMIPSFGIVLVCSPASTRTLDDFRCFFSGVLKNIEMIRTDLRAEEMKE